MTLQRNYTVVLGDDYYGFADYEYVGRIGVEEVTYLTWMSHNHVQMPMRASFCLMFTLAVPLLIIAAAAVRFKRRRHPPA
jgi:hypothetical protein